MRADPFAWYSDEFEYKLLDSGAGFYAELPHLLLGNDEIEEVLDHGCYQQKHAVLIHERFWKSLPSEVIVHLVKHLFLLAPLVVEYDDFLVFHVPIVGNDATIGVFLFPKMLLAIFSSLPLKNQTAVLYIIERIKRNGQHLTLYVVDFHLFPVRVFHGLLIEGLVSFRTDIE